MALRRLALALCACAAAAAALDVAAAITPPDDDGAASLVTCSWDSGRGASFNLEALKKLTGDYVVTDINAGKDPARDYDYVFNVCENVGSTPVPKQNHDGTPVPAAESACLDHHRLPSPGLQVANTWNGCYRLAADVHSQHGSNITWGLLDPRQPHKGVTLTYNFGEDCGGFAGMRRDLQLAFVCSDDATASFEDEEPEFVEETDICHYEIYLNTAFGCPTQCPIVDGHICGGHGVCGYDYKDRSAMCLCNTGYFGDACTGVLSDSGDDGGVDGTGAVLIVMCIILSLIIGAVVYMFFKLRRLNVDPNSFTELKGLYNELGQIA
mmetsp:Transcript_7969/g.28419  ORF Transcript_7969/g.28419 Transcript_7969/m.28419 type:complete len:324 (-) Transcript_7969:141-1112(-)